MAVVRSHSTCPPQVRTALVFLARARRDVALSQLSAALIVSCMQTSAVQLLDERKKGDDRDNRQARKVIRFLERTLRQQR